MALTFNRAIEELQGGSSAAAEYAKQLESSFSSAFTSFVTGALSAKEAASQLLGQLAELFAQSAFKSLIGDSNIFGSIGSFLASANGNAFANGRVQAFASGGIVNSPTVFPMANGAGLMGEAGPEAIMPLTRIGGKLGVRAAGGGSTTISIDARGAVEGTDVLIMKRLREAYPGLMRDSVSANRVAAGRGR